MTNDSPQTNCSPTTQSPQSPAPAPILCWVGLDWADKKHCLVVRTAGVAKPETHLVEHKPEALDAWFLKLRQDHPQGRIAVAIEQSRGPVLYALMKYDFLALYPVNPRCLADYRRAFKGSGACWSRRDVGSWMIAPASATAWAPPSSAIIPWPLSCSVRI